MATREEYERRFLAAVNNAWEYARDLDGCETASRWNPKAACEALAREVAAALAELAPAEQTEAAKCEFHINAYETLPPEAKAALLKVVQDSYPKPQPATPPAPEPAGEVATDDDRWNPNVWFDRWKKYIHTLGYPEAWLVDHWDKARPFIADAGALVMDFVEADQRAAVEAACAPLRERVRELEGRLLDLDGELAAIHLGDEPDYAKRIAALEAELAKARKAGA